MQNDITRNKTTSLLQNQKFFTDSSKRNKMLTLLLVTFYILLKSDVLCHNVHFQTKSVFLRFELDLTAFILTRRTNWTVWCIRKRYLRVTDKDSLRILIQFKDPLTLLWWSSNFDHLYRRLTGNENYPHQNE